MDWKIKNQIIIKQECTNIDSSKRTSKHYHMTIEPVYIREPFEILVLHNLHDIKNIQILNFISMH